jgi:hypothetical protein
MRLLLVIVAWLALAGCAHPKVVNIDYETGRFTVCGGDFDWNELEAFAQQTCAPHRTQTFSCGHSPNGAVAVTAGNVSTVKPTYGDCCVYRCL